MNPRAACHRSRGVVSRIQRRAKQLAAATVALAIVAGCSTVPEAVDRRPSTAFTDTDGSALGRAAIASRPAAAIGDPTISGVQLVSKGEEAFGTLYTLISRAQRSLDLQYYIVADDPYSRTLLRAAREAAERGVRVRLLVDDFYTSGEDTRIAWYAAHPNIEVRLFNPFFHGRNWFATRLVTAITDIGRINRRMHNKLFVADNAIAVTGGRNVGSEYYMHSARTNFLDLDVIAGGPVVHDLSETFDRYWNSPFAYPIETLTRRGDADAATIDQQALSNPRDPVRAATDEARSAGTAFAAKLDAGDWPLLWVPTELVADRPSKIRRTAPRVGPGGLVDGATIATDVLSIIGSAQRELVIISPYFVPGERGCAAIERLVARGVRVRVLTNSLAATDAAVVHIGYAKYRRRLIAAGVEIHELRPEPGEENTRLSALGSSKASLHAKVLIVDRRILFVGSFNVDQRSALENTEMGLRIESPRLAEEVLGVLRDRGPAGSYAVTLDDGGHLLWTTETQGRREVWHDEPGAGTLLKWSLKLLGPIAPEEML